MKLLIIEDSRTLVESLKKVLGRTFVIDVARSGQDGLRMGIDNPYDVILLDLGLPDKNGAEVCRGLRAAQITTPILVLTATDDVATRVALLNTGADDFVAKPFHVAELRARLGALVRRSPDHFSPNTFTVHDMTIDTHRRRVERAGKRIDLRRKEFDILECLARNYGRPVTRPMLLDYAWEGASQSWNNTVDVHIKHLRDKIDRPFKKPLIKTAYGIGYMLDDM